MLWAYLICYCFYIRHIKKELIPRWCLDGIASLKRSLQRAADVFGKELYMIQEALNQAESELANNEEELKICN